MVEYVDLQSAGDSLGALGQTAQGVRRRVSISSGPDTACQSPSCRHESNLRTTASKFDGKKHILRILHAVFYRKIWMKR